MVLLAGLIFGCTDLQSSSANDAGGGEQKAAGGAGAAAAGGSNAQTPSGSGADAGAGAGSSAPGKPEPPPGTDAGAVPGACTPSAEQCDGVDNDCDGRIDGHQELCGSAIGSCRQGTRTCVAGMWSACEGGVEPRAEVCEGQGDEDCDTAVDNGCACTAGATRACGSETGACTEGTQSCEAGVWGSECSGSQGPTSEVCDGQDQDCNGVDDDPFTNLGDACSVGAGACARSGSYECNPSGSGSVCGAVAGTPLTEVCANNLDDDCDGDTDEAPLGRCCADSDCLSTQKCGSAGMCVAKTWCELQTRPAGVAASDYACADFEGGLPGTPWMSAAGGQGQLALSTARAESAPNSVRSQVNAESTSGTAEDRGQLSWTAIGSANVTSVSIAAAFNPATAPEVVNDSGWVDLLCIKGTTEFCVSHATTSGYVGLQLVEHRSTGGAFQNICDVAAPARTLPLNTWTRFELRASTTGPATLFINGVQATVSFCSHRLESESTVTGVVGLHANPTTAAGYTAFFDNVVITARR